MSAFKDAVAADIEKVFLDADVFADYHVIDGERVKCLIDTDVTSEANASLRLEGVFIKTIKIYVSSDAFERRPVEKEHISIDGSDPMYFVSRVSEEMGMLVITCVAYDQ